MEILDSSKLRPRQRHKMLHANALMARRPTHSKQQTLYRSTIAGSSKNNSKIK